MHSPYVPAVTDDVRPANATWVSVPALTFDPVDAVDTVCDAYHEAMEPNWDGENGHAVSLATLVRACHFVLSLPDGVPMPDVDPSPRGTLLFEWYAAPRRRLTISVGPSADLAFAAILGRSQFHGTTPFDGAAPPAAVDLVYRVTG